MDILQDDKYWKHELNIQSRGSKSQNIIKFQELVMVSTFFIFICIFFRKLIKLFCYNIGIQDERS